MAPRGYFTLVIWETASVFCFLPCLPEVEIRRLCFAPNGLAHTFHNGVARVALRGAGGLATAGGARKYSCGEFGRWGVLTGGKRMDGYDGMMGWSLGKL